MCCYGSCRFRIEIISGVTRISGRGGAYLKTFKTVSFFRSLIFVFMYDTFNLKLVYSTTNNIYVFPYQLTNNQNVLNSIII